MKIFKDTLKFCLLLLEYTTYYMLLLKCNICFIVMRDERNSIYIICRSDFIL